MDELVEHDLVDSYRIIQIKEKYGSLRWYDNGGTDKLYHEIIPKYERLSMRTCIGCGKLASLVSTGWICPWCDDCAADGYGTYVPIGEFYKSSDSDEEEEDES